MKQTFKQICCLPAVMLTPVLASAQVGKLRARLSGRTFVATKKNGTKLYVASGTDIIFTSPYG